MNASVKLLTDLQKKTDCIRNLCILAHVDHGKTTMSDHLIASNGLIHPRLVGELRYLDSRDDEQARGITMKSSAICLLHVPGATSLPGGAASCTDEDKRSKGFLVNLIDSPGHVDFCSEVSTAARLSDGALVIVDAVEGVCIQTHAVLRQAWQEKVRMCLVINKMDRLVHEVKLSPEEAYNRVRGIITHVNMILSAFQSEQHISDADAVIAHEDAKATVDSREQHEDNEEPEVDEDMEFSPEKGNVAFGSAHDGWAFRVGQFADLYEAKLGFKASALIRALWGDYRIDAKSKRILRIKASQAGKYKPLFVQFILEPLWKAYEALEAGADVKGILGKIVKGLSLSQVSEKAISHPDAKTALRAVMRGWLPLSEAVLNMAAEQLPSPLEAAPERVPHLLSLDALEAAGAPRLPADKQRGLSETKAAMTACSTNTSAPLVIYVSKMIAVPASTLPRIPGEPGPRDPKQEVFLAFARIFSGVVTDGQRVHVLSAAYNPARPDLERQEVQVDGLYLMMGQGLERLRSVPAGCVLALGGLQHAILKSATLCSSPTCRPLAPMLFQASPIVRVAVESARPAEMPQLEEGLRLLNRADPFVEVSVLDSGEYVIGAAGEVHLETIVKDLRERFARVELSVSPPLVAFRESVFIEAEAPEPGHKPPKVVEATTANGLCTLRVRALPLPSQVTSVLDNHSDLLQRLMDAPAAAAAAGIQNTSSHGAAFPGRSPHQGAPQGGGLAEGVACLSLSDDAQRQASDASWTLLNHPADSSAGGSREEPAAASDASAQAELQQERSAPGGSSKQEGAPSANEAGSSSAPAAVGHSNGDGPAAAEGVAGDVEAFQGRLRAAADEAGTLAGALLQRAWLLGPKQVGPNLLLMSHATEEGDGLWSVSPQTIVPLGRRSHATHSVAEENEPELPGEAPSAQAETRALEVPLGDGRAAAALGFAGGAAAAEREAWQDLRWEGIPGGVRHAVSAGVAAGFQMAAAAGPLCDEPLWGVAFEVAARLNLPEAGELALAEDVYGPFSGQVSSAARQALRRAVAEAHPLLVEAMLLCELSSTSDVLSGTYAVLGKRRARVVREELREGSDLFSILAYMPAQASFGLADDLRRRTSGGASAALMLSHWERLQVDPFFVPTTEEEREEFGEEGQGVGTANLARTFIDEIRRRKGLAVDRKVVESATKQRTRARKV
ncbi:g3719 [Coccomyxa elongata]